ncbi:MAG: bifunctional 4'-phosphopantothenoylcysteine decarboxylase/phosphopantothenoylcysteine synthetase [SAR202 cluster bacterium Io17-Chloro-G9]|nr:MAG: bifunctional 4'-phosphopantothenoylcysteine decarboxylase/phosphopantothenoylcysteine synthetase [SAR202 cluster bacterium Io17-Chloro-G9]
MPSPLEGRAVALGVSGSIAAYKAVDLASKLTQAGALVDVVMTPSAQEFVTALTFQSITQRPVTADPFDPQTEMGIDHVAVAERAGVVVVAPATANTIAKMAHGIADDALSIMVLATIAPIVVCPAMDVNMYANPATQHNIQTLKDRGVVIAGPASGRMASGLSGAGRMIEPLEIIGHVCLVLGREGDLAGLKIVVSAGGTQEPIDPVRFISNRSSGKMGYAIAEAARDRGAAVTIVAAPGALADPVGVRVIRVETALEMQHAVVAATEDADALIMAAAVADWRPEEAADNKLKSGGAATSELQLKKTPDIVAGLTRDGLVKVGFAAETEDLVSNAQEKLAAKGLDLIVANDVSVEGSGFGADTNEVVLIDANGGRDAPGLLPKYEVGHRILDRVAALLK